MSRAAQFGWFFFLLLFLVGCTKDEDYVDVQREQLAAWQEMAEILETVKDDTSMAKAKKALDQRNEKYAALARKAKALPAPRPEAQQRMQELKFFVESAIERLQKEAGRVSRLPGGPEFMKHFQSASQGLSSAVQP